MQAACSSSPSPQTAATCWRAGPQVTLDAFNFGGLEMVNGRSRLATRFHREVEIESFGTRPLEAAAALALGLVTFAPDELDWEDEIRLAVEERAASRPTR